MTLDQLIVGYRKEYKKRYNKNDFKRISKKIDELFLILNVDPILFKEHKKRNSAWNFPKACEEDFITLIKYLDICDESVLDIRRGDVKRASINVLKFFIDTIIKGLKALNCPQDQIEKVSKEMLIFTNYSFISVKNIAQELYDDLDYMYNNDEDDLSFSDHQAFDKYAELEIRKLQEHLRYTYYTMNFEKGSLKIQKESKKIKKIDEDGKLHDYFQKRMEVNNRVFKALGGIKGLNNISEEELQRKREEIEIELYGEKLTKHPYVEYVGKRLNLDKILEEDKEYQNILQCESDLIDKKVFIKDKVNRLVEYEEKKLKRVEELSQNMGETFLAEEYNDDEAMDSVKILEDGICTAKMFRVAKQKSNENDWPIMISMCDELFERKNK